MLQRGILIEPKNIEQLNQSKRLGAIFLRLILLWVGIYLIINNESVYAGDLAKPTIKQQSMNPAAPPESHHFGRLVGEWKITDWSIDAQGKRQDGPGANWNFYWILGGSAIQDDWISPGYDKPVPEKGRQFGTNIRIYNPKSKLWEMAWMSNSGAKLDTFKANGTEKEMVMRGVYNGAETKITFYDIETDQFSWKMEKLQGTEQWKVVYRIEAKRVK
jgi:hypothetical protein